MVLFLLLTILPSHPLSSGEYENSIIASVNGHPFTLYDIVRETYGAEARKSNFMTGNDFKQELIKNREKTLGQIIDRYILYEEFKAKQYKIPDDYIEALMDEICLNYSGGDRKKLEKKVAEAGMTIDELREQVTKMAAIDLLVNEFCFRIVNVTPAQSYQYYLENQNDYIDPEKVDMQILLIKKDGKNAGKIFELIEEIANDCKRADESIFATLIKLYSEGTYTDNGAKTGRIESKNMRDEFKNAFGELKVGKIAGPIDTKEGIYFVRIAEIVPEKITDFALVKTKITEKLEKEEKEKKYQEYLKKLKAKSIIRYYYDLDP